jgi:hypothetical protein
MSWVGNASVALSDAAIYKDLRSVTGNKISFLPSSVTIGFMLRIARSSFPGSFRVFIRGPREFRPNSSSVLRFSSSQAQVESEIDHHLEKLQARGRHALLPITRVSPTGLDVDTMPRKNEAVVVDPELSSLSPLSDEEEAVKKPARKKAKLDTKEAASTAAGTSKNKAPRKTTSAKAKGKAKAEPDEERLATPEVEDSAIDVTAAAGEFTYPFLL